MEQCFAYSNGKCGALREGTVCASNCKFFKTREQLRDYKRHSDIESFVLLIDGRSHGEFNNIEEIDDYLKKYYLLNKETEDHRYGSKFKGEYNVLFENHNIRFLLKEELDA